MLERSEIEQLWASGEIFREIAAEEIVRHFEHHSQLFFDLLPTDNTEVLPRHAKGEFLFLMKGFDSPEAYDLVKKCAVFDNYRQQEIKFREALSSYMNRLPEEAREPYSAIIRRYFPDMFCNPEPSKPDSRQLMVFVTGICNLKCPYCFSSDLEKEEIPLDQLRRVFDWASRQGVTKITPCGGEPLIYPYFKEFVTMAKERGMSVYFASNLTVPLQRFPELTADMFEGTYAHLTAATRAGKELFGIFASNVRYCLSRGISVTGRLNITNPDPQLLYPYIRDFKDMGVQGVNFALTIPSTMATNKFMAIGNVDAYVDTVSSLIGFAESLGMSAGIAKPLPVCRFPEAALMKLLGTAVGGSRCDIDSDDFMHNIALSPQMEFSPCLGLEKIKIPFSDEITWQELQQQFGPVVRSLLCKPLYAHCQECYLWKRRLCQGACLTYKQ